MAEEFRVPPEKAEEPRHQGACDRQRVVRTLRIMEKGTKEAFLDGELEVEQTKTILDRIKQAREACESGDQNACMVLNSLMHELTRE